MGDQDLRQRRRRRGRARGPVHRRPARARAPHDRDGALPDRRARPASTPPTRASRASSTRARSGSSRASTRTAASTTSRPAATARGARTASPTPGTDAVGTDLNRNWGFRWGCCGGSSGDRLDRDLPRPVRVLGARDGRRCATSSSAASSTASSRSGRRSTSTPSASCPVAVRPHARRRDQGHDPRPARHLRGARHQHGPHQRLHRPSSRATSTSPTARSTTGCGAPTASSPSRSRCTRADGGPPASTRPTR